MGLVKVVKNNAYFKRFQVKFRRRREGKTDYYARKRLIWQDKTKYGTPKYRLVVRITNTTVICQIVSAHVEGDKVFSSAYSSELPKYGLKVGLTNYAAAYATGLLIARRTLKKLGMDTMYLGCTVVDGKTVELPINEDRRPFTVNLDVGLRRTTTGANIFGALKGAVDGGLNVPHSEKRFPGYTKENYDAEKHKDRILGKHIADYMRSLQDEDEQSYQQHFSRYVKEGVNADNLEETILKCHQTIRADPTPKAKEEVKVQKEEKQKRKKVKMNLKQKKDRIRQIKETYLKTLRSENEN